LSLLIYQLASPYQVPDVAKIERGNKLGGEENNSMKSQNTPVLCPHIVYAFRSMILGGLGQEILSTDES
jgi:hypothetical protein